MYIYATHTCITETIHEGDDLVNDQKWDAGDDKMFWGFVIAHKWPEGPPSNTCVLLCDFVTL